jgi:signal transduction histidine kinase
MNLPIAFRRRSPVAVLWAVVVLTLPFWVLDYPDEPAGPNVLIAIYSLAAHGERPRAIRHFWAAVVVLMTVLVAGVISAQENVPWFAVPADFVVFATAWILGDNLRTRRDYLAELEAKAAMTERQREIEARRAVVEERTRIARELHDVVAHSMSVMVVQAGAARRVLGQDPDQAAEALRAIEETGRESLTEMRRVLGVLRSEDHTAELVPAPSLDDFDRLFRQCEEAGLPVDLVVEGDVRRLAAGVELSAYRVVQESLTNSLKHAGPARATVRLGYRADMLEVQVTDDGRGAAATTGAGSGQGLVGMRERVEAVGGSLDAGPRPGGGYAVAASIPLEAGSLRAR